MAPMRVQQSNEIFSRETAGIRVSIRAIFLEDQSQPEDRHFAWAYQVRIENIGIVTMQLLRRTWLITDGNGHMQQVRGPGVVGEQPVLDPGDVFEYTSGVPLETPSGFMTGTYHMIAVDTGENYDIAIPSFSLDSPHGDHRLH
ncbi:MAG: Co2+/Mg2+ efflux protein ApaG [Acidiphilium sp.]|nr:Co2+/Mg2+ efflux protein ApaG [Acidiphilium sp.]MDD4937205.1 Co2+/Mg2+ efflux protein ApaG [Acidiphilium sp.]